LEGCQLSFGLDEKNARAATNGAKASQSVAQTTLASAQQWLRFKRTPAGREDYFEIERETQAEKKSPGYSRG
jgi:hypothetical protein